MFTLLSPPRMLRRALRLRSRLLFLVLLATLGPAGLDMGMAVVKPIHEGNGKTCRIWSVTDGDTLKLACLTRGLVNTRLRGFDTPELFSPGCPSEFARAVAATWLLRWKLWGAEHIEVRIGSRDLYGRSLATVLLDGRPLAAIMVGSGLARAYDGGRRQGWCGGLI
ncbi:MULTISPECIES: thermonuclease family protein [Haematobacter]|uniref:TNase-like domain-containing protein n=1 Tax=Haematobacter genomosp. 1 TaxID=366618 RepID=A0A212AD55_9RHOB|nr:MULTISPECIES: thermonuclease family protein [Haematobacter]OWJ78802.1 hypothetical protein CDV49_06765 [Haematobacter genomosp. 1]